MAVEPLFLICAVITLIVYLISNYYLKQKEVDKLPPMGGGALPFVGHTFLLLANKKRIHQVILNTILGPTFKNGDEAATIRIGNLNLYVLMNPDDCYLLANSCFKKDPLLYGFFKPMFGEYGLFTADVPAWKRYRKLLNPTFKQKVLETYLTDFNDRSRELVESLSKEMGKGSFDELPYLRQLVLQVVCATLIGVSSDEKDVIEKVSTALEVFMNSVVERVLNVCYHNDFLFGLSQLKKQQDVAIGCLNKFTYEVLRTKKRNLIAHEDNANEYSGFSESHGKSFLDLLIDLSKDDTLTETEILEEVNTFIGGALDTTYNALGIMFLTLGSYPEVQKKVFDEQQEIFNGTDRDVGKQDMSKLKYLEAFIKETQRLYPSGFLVGRILDMDLKFKKYSLPAGSRCYMSIYHICRHPVWGPDAEQFRPERWLDGSLPSNARAYAVFGLGRRGCIGYNYAMMLMKTALSHVVRRYSVTGDVTKLVQKLHVVVTSESGHHVSIERREDNEIIW